MKKLFVTFALILGIGANTYAQKLVGNTFVLEKKAVFGKTAEEYFDTKLKAEERDGIYDLYITKETHMCFIIKTHKSGKNKGKEYRKYRHDLCKATCARLKLEYIEHEKDNKQ